MAILENIERKN